MKKELDKDAYGKGLLAYWNGKRTSKFTVHSDIAETEKWPISTFFRDYEEMSQAEKTALDKCQGAVLDIGAGAGCHSLWLQQHQHKVTAIDISAGAVEVMKLRGVQDVCQADFFSFNQGRYDTLLLLMNGVGIVKHLDNLGSFFSQANNLLAENGRILLDSSNLIYLYMDDEGGVDIDLNGSYYGELKYKMDFESCKGEWFDWVFIDFETLQDTAAQYGFECEKIFEDDHYLYLAELKRK